MVLDNVSLLFSSIQWPIASHPIGLKILSGYALVGRMNGISWLSELHQNRTLDLLLLAGEQICSRLKAHFSSGPLYRIRT